MSGAEDRVSDGFDLTATPELADLLRAAMRIVRMAIRTHVPAVIVSYDPARKRATVAVQQLQVVRVTDPTRIPATMLAMKGVPPNAEATLAPAILTDIPVAMPAGTLGGLSIPLAPGDEGELHVSDRSLAAWLQTGAPSDPALPFTHALTDSVFHPGLHSDPHVGPPTDMTATVLDGAALVKIGAAAVDFLVKATPLITAIDVLANFPVVGGDNAASAAAAFAAFKTAWTTAKLTLATTKAQGE